MIEKLAQAGRSAVFFLALAVVMTTSTASGGVDIPGIQGPDFQLTTGAVYITTPDGDTLKIWAYGDSGSMVQYPGPTLIVDQGDVVSIELTNGLTVPTSMVFPGHEVTATGGTAGLLTAEAAPLGGTVTYSFTATHAGTYTYHSGTQPDLQVEMGLLGALIVRPTGYDATTNRIAYGHADTAYDHEYLMLLSEMDPMVHDLVDFGHPEFIDNTAAFPVLWFINGRNAVDTLAAPNVPWQPYQPYNAVIQTRPGEKVLLRFIGGGRDLHPLHPHGNHSTLIARDGRMLESVPGVSGPDLATADFTHNIMPGATYDALFDWTGERLGWDIYGDPLDPNFAHDCDDTDTDGFDDDIDGAGPDIATHEWCDDHGKPIPVTLPGLQDITFGGFYSGDAFLGSFGNLPPGEGGLNLNGGLFFPAHSHNEKELTNNDIFLGGMLTFIIIEPPWVEIP